MFAQRTGMKVSQMTRKRDVCLRKRAGIAQCHRKGPMPVNALPPFLPFFLSHIVVTAEWHAP